MKIYTIPEVAKLLKCSERQIFRYLKKNKLKGSLQGKWRFTDDDVRDFLKAGRKKTPSGSK